MLDIHYDQYCFFPPIPRNSLKLTAKAREKWLLADYFVLLGPGLFSGEELLVLGRVLVGSPHLVSGWLWWL